MQANATVAKNAKLNAPLILLIYNIVCGFGFLQSRTWVVQRGRISCKDEMHCLSQGVQKSPGSERSHALTWRTADKPHIPQNGMNQSHFDHQWIVKTCMLICPIAWYFFLCFNRETGTFICLRLLKATPSSYLCQYLSRTTRSQPSSRSAFCASRKMRNKAV